MANQPETDTYDVGVYQWQTTDPVEGGLGGVANTPLLNLANRTGWLYNQVNILAAEIAVLAPLNSPNFTGSPTVPFVAAGDSSNKAINSAFLQAALNGLTVVNCAGTANVTLVSGQYGVNIIILTGAVTAPINVIFPTQAGAWLLINRTTGSPVTCKTAGGSGIIVASGQAAGLICDGTNIVASNTDSSRVNNLVSSAQALFSHGTYTDPDPGITRDAKFGQGGIAVLGGAKTDSLNVTGQGLVNNLQAVTGVFNKRQAFNASGTWTCPYGVYAVKAWVTGGGAGGAGSTGTTPGSAESSGSGGGAGGTAIGVVGVTPGTVYPVTVGSGGAANVAGGNSSFVGLVGFGGVNGGYVSSINSPGGSGGNASGGTDNHKGGDGQDGQNGSFTNAGAMGGASYWGGGGRGGAPNGASGQAEGSGGGGSYGGGSGAVGGAGANGVVILEW